MKGDAGRDVGFNDAGDDGGARGLRGDDQVNASGAGFGGEDGDVIFHFGGGDLHKIGELIDDHDDVGEAIRQRFLGGGGRGSRGFPAFHLRGEVELLNSVRDSNTGVESGDIPDPCLGHVTVTFLHFDNHPAESEKNFLGFGNDGDNKVRQAIVNLEFDYFGINEDEAKIIWAKAVEKAEEKSVNADRFSGAGRAGDEGVGKIGQIVDQGGSVDIFS